MTVNFHGLYAPTDNQTNKPEVINLKRNKQISKCMCLRVLSTFGNILKSKYLLGKINAYFFITNHQDLRSIYELH